MSSKNIVEKSHFLKCLDYDFKIYDKLLSINESCTSNLNIITNLRQIHHFRTKTYVFKKAMRWHSPYQMELCI